MLVLHCYFIGQLLLCSQKKKSWLVIFETFAQNVTSSCCEHQKMSDWKAETFGFTRFLGQSMLLSNVLQQYIWNCTSKNLCLYVLILSINIVEDCLAKHLINIFLPRNAQIVRLRLQSYTHWFGIIFHWILWD